MALLDRVKERIETDLGDTELQAMIDAVTAEIERRYGAAAEQTVTLEGGGEILSPVRPIDTGETVAIVEIETAGHGDAASRTTLSADDYRIQHGGRTVQRLKDGTNGRSVWAPEVELTYTPVSDARQREEVTIQIVALDIQSRALGSERAGDFQASYADLAAEREKLLRSQMPRTGGMVFA